MTNEKFEVLSEYLKFISVNHNIQISIHSFTGFLIIGPILAELLQPFMIHSNDYCMYIKSNKDLFDRCLAKRCAIAQKCMSKKTTYRGMCYAGVEEYVVPVFHGTELIATIFAGIFRSNNKVADYLINKNAKRYNLDPEIMSKNYYGSLSPIIPDQYTITSLLNIVAQYLENIYLHLMQTHGESFKNKQHNSVADHILAHALDYIHRNFENTMRVSDIARHCHCSESYISHIFKRNMNVSISNYTNQLRIEKAKKLLVGSDIPIKNIAGIVGFNDPNYFSKVFHDICGIFPTQYKKMINS